MKSKPMAADAINTYLADQRPEAWSTFCNTLLTMGMPFTFVDAYTHEKHNGEVKLSGEIYISYEGLGLCEMETGCGEVVACEWHNGKPQVIIWDDINDGDPTVLDLTQALESNRKADEC